MRQRRFFCFIIYIIIAVGNPQTAAYAVVPSSATTRASATSPPPSQGNHPKKEEVSSTKTSSSTFYIQGWRWHTQALARDARRLSRLAKNVLNHHPIPDDDTDDDDDQTKVSNDLQQATDYTINFNMRGLHKIETKVFFPWLRNYVIPSISDIPIQRSLADATDQLERYQQQLESLGKAMFAQSLLLHNNNDPSSCNNNNNYNNTPQSRRSAVAAIAELSATIARTIQSMTEQQVEPIVVPIIARFISQADQTALNSKVIRTLGVLDSRIHLVSMYETIRDNPQELQVFQQMIPSLPQRLIPRWKRLLYDPRIGGLVNTTTIAADEP